MWFVADNHNDMKGVLDSNLNQAVSNKISNFHEMPQISHIHKNHIFLKF